MKQIITYSGRILLTVAMVACAAVLGGNLWNYYMAAPWTRDGRICSDVVKIAPDVSGLVSEVLVRDNQRVHKGDILFRVDPVRFELAFRQAQAQLTGARAALEMAQHDLARYQAAVKTSAISLQQLEQAETTLEQASSNYNQALANRDLARLNLDRSAIKAPVNGIINNFSLKPGDYAATGVLALVLIDTDSFYVSGYFEETKLERIHIGDAAVISPMGSKGSIQGHVESIAFGIHDRERDPTGVLINVTPTFSWVRLAQRVPVRIHIDSVPDSVRLISGRTVNVKIIEDASQSQRKQMLPHEIQTTHATESGN
ncbi:MAG: hypothetical protein PWQ89_931 [Verrucomicrobiota bacterium]|jgi:multidrug resistance efflux pump|nr:hypothetical protein [Verrucomicrobiota bacterium]